MENRKEGLSRWKGESLYPQSHVMENSNFKKLTKNKFKKWKCSDIVLELCNTEITLYGFVSKKIGMLCEETYHNRFLNSIFFMRLFWNIFKSFFWKIPILSLKIYILYPCRNIFISLRKLYTLYIVDLHSFNTWSIFFL